MLFTTSALERVNVDIIKMLKWQAKFWYQNWSNLLKADKNINIKFVWNIRSTILIMEKVSDRISSKDKRNTRAILAASVPSKSFQSLQNR